MSQFGEDYEYETCFDKQKALNLAAKIRQSLFKMDVPNEVWQVAPTFFTYRIAPKKDDISDIVEVLYRIEEVLAVSQGIEPNTKVRIITVQLKPRWYVDDEKDENNAKARRRHPEDRE